MPLLSYDTHNNLPYTFSTALFSLHSASQTCSTPKLWISFQNLVVNNAFYGPEWAFISHGLPAGGQVNYKGGPRAARLSEFFDGPGTGGQEKLNIFRAGRAAKMAHGSHL